MDYYASNCPDCRRTYRWLAYKVGPGTGKTQAQLDRDKSTCRHCGGVSVTTELDSTLDGPDSLTRALSPTVEVPPVVVPGDTLPPRRMRLEKPAKVFRRPEVGLLPSDPPESDDPWEMLLSLFNAKARTAEAQKIWSSHYGSTEEYAAAKARMDAYQDAVKMVKEVLGSKK